MRPNRTVQTSIFDVFSEHEIGRELKSMSHWLDDRPEVLALVAADLCRGGVKQTGREGIPVEAVLRCALLKQYRQLSYEELAFYVSDSASFRAFARLPVNLFPKKSVLHKTISAICAETWERINLILLHSAKQAKLENGRMLRLDSTVIEAPIHEPTDNSLLWDSVRVMVRLLRNAGRIDPGIVWHDHSRRARKRARAIDYSRGYHNKRQLYRDLIAVSRTTLGYVQAAIVRLSATPPADDEVEAWLAAARHYRSLIERIIAQAERRVVNGEQVPAGDKLVSLFEPHSAIIVKSRREVQYGHKLNLTAGISGMILDVVIEAGNPADVERFVPMLRRHIAHYDSAPRQTAADGAFASLDNLAKAKALGVKDVAFHKKRGLTIEDMVKSRWVYRKLRNFRAGIEAGISCLKRAYGLARCTWKGLAHFRAYVWSSVVAYNLALFARLLSG